MLFNARDSEHDEVGCKIMRSKIWVVLMLGIVSLPLTLGCFTENHQTRVSKGAQLTIVTGTPKIAQEIVFKHENEIRKITPNANKELVAVYLGIVNSDVGKASLYIDSEAAVLRDTDYKTHSILDPFSESEVITSQGDYTDSQLMEYVPLLWGNQTLMKDYQITGFLIFEVPIGREWQSLNWYQGDTVVAKFPE